MGGILVQSVKLEEQLKSFIVQLQVGSGILDRIVYKGKNQHRRCLYFQYILKVRRDVRLLLSARLEDILNFLFQVINGKKPNQTVYLLESLKRRKCNSEKHNFEERLLEVARLLSQMVEPMVKAATEISTLLARSFFMGFSLTILALLARLRILVQQMLLNVVSVFNMVSSLSQKGQSVKLNRHGIEVFREYYPSNDEVITLECVWEKDKFVLLERTNKTEIKNLDGDCGIGMEIPLRSSNIQYQSIEVLGDDELGCEKMDTDDAFEEIPDLINTKRLKSDASADQPIKIGKSTEVELEEFRDDEGNRESLDKNLSTDSDEIAGPSPLPSPKFPQLQTESRKKVAFISIGKLKPSQTNESRLLEKLPTADLLATKTCDEEDPFFGLLTGGNMKDSLF
ncbi:protein of unknown function DUF4477 [Macleaya cordata]|uniref:Nucleolus and neural progenitor protein-like N-terminal domain-containing protein n=1 Tax=Macleaya cordata TaxID=56857 RepID=A0A200R815_MACCD|nr:protein of unknown function DUF4477 [Macleaya cordata]